MGTHEHTERRGVTGGVIARIASVGGIALGWLVALGAVWENGLNALRLLTGRNILGPEGQPLDVCYLPNFCATSGPDETPLPMEAVSHTTRLFSGLASLLMVAVVLVAAYLGTRALLSISNGNAFGTRTVSRLQWAATTLLAGGVVGWFLEETSFSRANDEVAQFSAMHAASQGSVTVGMTPFYPTMAVLFGVFTLVAWAALRQGATMREELDHVI